MTNTQNAPSSTAQKPARGADFVERRGLDGHTSLVAVTAKAHAYVAEQVAIFGDDCLGHLPSSLFLENRCRADFLEQFAGEGWRVLELPS